MHLPLLICRVGLDGELESVVMDVPGAMVGLIIGKVHALPIAYHACVCGVAALGAALHLFIPVFWFAFG